MQCELLSSHPDYCRLSALPGIAVDLRYASANNFVGYALYQGIDCDWIHREAAAGLLASANWLKRHYPEYQILVLDALRPNRIQIKLWEFLDGTNLRIYVADPALGSIHSYGKAIDVTLTDQHGVELDMGSDFDELNEKSHPVLEKQLLQSQQLSSHHLHNRTILRNAMEAGGFHGIRSEWWHFNHGDPAFVRASYLKIE